MRSNLIQAGRHNFRSTLNNLERGTQILTLDKCVELKTYNYIHTFLSAIRCTIFKINFWFWWIVAERRDISKHTVSSVKRETYDSEFNFFSSVLSYNLLPRVFSLSNMAAVGEKTLAHIKCINTCLLSFLWVNNVAKMHWRPFSDTFCMFKSCSKTWRMLLVCRVLFCFVHLQMISSNKWSTQKFKYCLKHAQQWFLGFLGFNEQNLPTLSLQELHQS